MLRLQYLLKRVIKVFLRIKIYSLYITYFFEQFFCKQKNLQRKYSSSTIFIKTIILWHVTRMWWLDKKRLCKTYFKCYDKIRHCMVLPAGFLSPFRTTVSLQSSWKTLVQGMGMVDSTFTVFSGPPSSTFILSCDTWKHTLVPWFY